MNCIYRYVLEFCKNAGESFLNECVYMHPHNAIIMGFWHPIGCLLVVSAKKA